jgi:hypothetical protein
LHQASWWWWWWWWWSTRRVEEAEEIAPYERSWHYYGFGLYGTWLLHRMMATILKRQWGAIVQYFLLVLLSQMEEAKIIVRYVVVWTKTSPSNVTQS